jgi:hypothetical protein
MDRHAAYVGLSRHRDGVQLHYGQDDFASDAKLAAVLSRDRAKDMAADYAAEPDEAVRAFADKREIRLPPPAFQRRDASLEPWQAPTERVGEIVEKVEAKARSMFAGFRPKAAETSHDVPESTNELVQGKAIQRYARAAVDVAGMQEKGLPVLPHQKTALARAGEALDKARYLGTHDLASAIERNPKLAREAAAGNTRGAGKAMAEEARVRADPQLRAERFMERWQELEAERGDARYGPAVTRMAIMVDDLVHDPVLRKELERRAPELGLGRDRQQSAEQVLERQLRIDRDRALQQDRGLSR